MQLKVRPSSTIPPVTLRLMTFGPTLINWSNSESRFLVGETSALDGEIWNFWRELAGETDGDDVGDGDGGGALEVLGTLNQLEESEKNRIRSKSSANIITKRNTKKWCQIRINIVHPNQQCAQSINQLLGWAHKVIYNRSINQTMKLLSHPNFEILFKNIQASSPLFRSIYPSRKVMRHTVPVCKALREVSVREQHHGSLGDWSLYGVWWGIFRAPLARRDSCDIEIAPCRQVRSLSLSDGPWDQVLEHDGAWMLLMGNFFPLFVDAG